MVKKEYTNPKVKQFTDLSDVEIIEKLDDDIEPKDRDILKEIMNKRRMRVTQYLTEVVQKANINTTRQNTIMIILTVVLTIFALISVDWSNLVSKLSLISANNKLISVTSIIISIVLLSASYFQWWEISYDGKMMTKKWIKILFLLCIVALLILVISVIFGK